MPTQAEYTEAMVSQLRLLAPGIAANVGSVERMILEVVATRLVNQEISLNALAGVLDVNSKAGESLDRFLSLFGFARQQGTRATGYATFSCNTPPLNDIVIPANTQIYATITGPANTSGAPQSIVYFLTQFQAVIAAGSEKPEITVPVIAQLSGASGNVEANTITSFSSSPVYGITAVTNKLPTTGGSNEENDAEYKARFANTVFRNLAGTEDQYLGLIAATNYTTKATVIGPMSRYQEYLQIPPVSDEQSYEFINASGESEQISGNSTISGTYTTALSVVPNSKYIYTEVPMFVTNAQAGNNIIFYREGIDWELNTTPTSKNRGDAYRFWKAKLPGAENPLSTELPTIFQPNVTFMNVYRGEDSGVQTTKPEQVVLFEHAYMSLSSRNSVSSHVTNCVDIYVNGSNNVTAQTVVTAPGASEKFSFNEDPTSYLYKEKYQRVGEPGRYPYVKNVLLPLYNEPVTGLPSQIAVTGALLTSSGIEETTYYELGTHYWLVEDMSELYGTIRCRNGIEFSSTNPGYKSNPNELNGAKFTEYVSGTPVMVNGYTYDENIVTLQAACESSKQINTDVLVHKAHPRYFKLDIVVVYGAGAVVSSVNNSIYSSVIQYFERQTFGALIQLGSIIQILYSVPGVQNVRWSAELPFGPEKHDNKITETNINGEPIKNEEGEEIYFDEDFYLADDELPMLPTGQLETDTLPGLIIRPRAENTFVRGPYNPAKNSELPYIPPD